MIVIGPRDGFSDKLAENLGCEFFELERKTFPDREIRPRILGVENINSPGRVILASRLERPLDPNRYLVEILLTAKNIKSLGCDSITLVMPYMVYARQDKVFRPGEPLSAAYIMELMRHAGIERLVTVSCHFSGIETFCPGLKATSISGFKSIGKHLVEMGLKNPVVIGPDKKSGAWAKEIVDILGSGEYTFLEKHRDRNSGEVQTEETLSVDTSGRDVVIVDDIASSGGTLVNAINIVKKHQPKKIIIAVVHPILSGDCVEKVRTAGADMFLATDTIPSEISKISVIEDIARFIKTCEAKEV